MFRLGLCVGATSIGWWIYRLANGAVSEVVDGGVRIFSDGRDAKTGIPLAVARRNARAMRRRRDRYLRRRATLMKRLAAAGLMPEDPEHAKRLEALDPYRLRAEGLDRPIGLAEFARALFHINQRRGFKSNRRADRGNNDGGKIADGTARLDQAILAAGARTYGEFLHLRRSQAEDPRRVPSVRARLSLRMTESGKGELAYDIYPDRRHLEEEFQQLWAAQAKHHPVLNETLRATLFETIFFQRPLKDPKVGRCLFFPEPRLPKAHPLTQRRVLYETVNALRIRVGKGAAIRLTKEQRDRVILLLDSKRPVSSLASAKLSLKSIAKHLRLSEDSTLVINDGREEIACDPVRASLGHPDRFGPRWTILTDEAQAEIVARLQGDENTGALTSWLQQTHDLDEARARATADAPLPEGFGRLGMTATLQVLEQLKANVLTYDEAVTACGWHHSNWREGTAREALPYYGEVLQPHVVPGTGEPDDDDITRFGRISNPSVHIGLNQLRRLVNRIIQRYGKPDQIVVEIARELKQSADQKSEARSARARSRKETEQRSALLHEWGVSDSSSNRMRVRLWQELHEDPTMRRCPYSGMLISSDMLFSDMIDIDHILPYSRTLDDSTGNRTLCLATARNEKRNKSPWEAQRLGMRVWALEGSNLRHLPEYKRWRFTEDAMSRFEGEKSLESRALVDTQFLSRITQDYLETLFDEDDRVTVVPGNLTPLLRRHWGLDGILKDTRADAGEGNRRDFRSHAIDAAVIAATDRDLIKAVAKESGVAVEKGREAMAFSVPAPWAGFVTDVAAQIDRIIVSHRADHGRIDPQARAKGLDQTTGPLHLDTAYGLTKQSVNGVPLVVTRKPFDSLTPATIDKIRDRFLRAELKTATQGKSGKDFSDALLSFKCAPGPYHNIRRIRVIEPVSIIKIHDASGRAYKGYKGDGNHCYEVWRLPDDTLVEKVVSTFAAHQNDKDARPHPAAKRLIRLYKADMVKLDDSKFGPCIATVVKFDKNGTITLVAHSAANADERYRKHKEDVFLRFTARTLVASGARRIVVDETGRFRDPGRRC